MTTIEIQPYNAAQLGAYCAVCHQLLYTAESERGLKCKSGQALTHQCVTKVMAATAK